MAANLSKAETGGSQRTASMYLDCGILWTCEGFWGPEMAIVSRILRGLEGGSGVVILPGREMVSVLGEGVLGGRREGKGFGSGGI